MTNRLQNPAPEARPNPWLPEAVVIQQITTEMPDVATYDLAFVDRTRSTSYQFQPGQFNMLYLPGVGEIPISVSGDSQSTSTLAHTIRAVGNVTNGIASLQCGDTLGLRGPYGTSWPLADCLGRDAVLVAGGIGLAPLRPVIYHLLRHRQQFGQITLLYGIRRPNQQLYEREYSAWIRDGMAVEVTVDRSVSNWSGHQGPVTLLIEQLAGIDVANCVVMTCGPEVMMRFVAQSALQRGIPASRIWVTLERNMQCAIGLCGHCQLGPAFVCKTGPIFRYDHIAAWLAIEGL